LSSFLGADAEVTASFRNATARAGVPLTGLATVGACRVATTGGSAAPPVDPVSSPSRWARGSSRRTVAVEDVQMQIEPVGPDHRPKLRINTN